MKIGKIATQKEEVHGEFIGMIKLNNRGTEIFSQSKEIVLEQAISKSSYFSKGISNRHDSRIGRYRDKGSLCNY